MRPYQEEYIANLRQVAALVWRGRPDGMGFEEYAAQIRENEARAAQLTRRNMELLRGELFPMLDNLFDAGDGELGELEEFSLKLFNGRTELDVGLFCQIRQALLSVARQKNDRAAMIRELYWLGMGRNNMSSKLVGLELVDVEKFINRMRLCFTEAAAYLKFFDVIKDTETRGYIVRSRANISLGQFKAPHEKIRRVKSTLQILQDKGYQELEPGLPWERFIYLTHQNMASSISYSKERVMTAQDMADIMESVYIVHHRQIREAEEQGKQPPAKTMFSYYAIEYYCGISGLDQLLGQLEELLDAADPEDYSPDGMYAMGSLPAFYSQYLQQYPELVPPRREYLQRLYRRTLDYMDASPWDPGEGKLFLCLRQLAYTFVETEGGIPYGEFLQKLLLRFATEVYFHSQAVGEAAKEFCGVILGEDPEFFDDIDFIRAVRDPGEKRRVVEDYAIGCGIFHDVGKISVIELYSRTARQWFEEEEEMARLHVVAGEALLSPRPSTSRYAPAALGHHAWYDGSRGYPDAYRRLECPARQIVDVIGLMDWLEAATNAERRYDGTGESFEDAVKAAIGLEGKRFSPLLTARLRDAATVERIREAFAQGRGKALQGMYDAACQAPMG